jgi:superfamily II DNA or RNA helicase
MYNSIITDKNKKLLISYQINNTENLIRNISNNGAVLDASDTGTGKTYSAVCAVATMHLRPIVICPKSVMSIWKKVCKIFNVTPFFIVNYETIKNKKYYNENGDRVKCPYINYNDNMYSWKKLPSDVIFIFDEAHKCSGVNTYNGKLLIASKTNTPTGVMLLSATIADRAERFKIFFYILNFIDVEKAKELKFDIKEYMTVVDKWIFRSPNPILRIHNMLYPNRCTRMSIDVLGDLFPENQISVEPYYMGKEAENKIRYAYDEIYDAMNELTNKSKKDKNNPLVRVLRAQQKIELLKIPTFKELTSEYIDQGFSVVIFVNFTQTLKALSEMLSTKCLIYGEQTQMERDFNIDEFQEDRERIIICNIKAGGVGVSLHDLHGQYKRVSLISPCWSAIDLTQALGRIHRAGAKSKSLQRIIYCDNTVENNIADRIKVKLGNLQSLNNGDLTLDLKDIEYVNKPKQIIS